MRAAEQQRVDVGFTHGREQSLGEHVHLIAGRLASLDELDEARARRARELDAAPRSPTTARWYAPDPIVPTVPMTPTRPVARGRRSAPARLAR